MAEHLLRYTSFPLLGPLRKYHPVEARVVAVAMGMVAKGRQRGVHVFETDDINELGASANGHWLIN